MIKYNIYVLSQTQEYIYGNNAINILLCPIEYTYIIYYCTSNTGGTLLVAQLVEALRYKSEGRGFVSR